MTVKEENVDEIHLLNDVLANQIAAGEVIQRPASVAKELLENAIDAKATKITLSFTNGGKTGIQVTDNGKGMSETDARMSFERHATSKIQTSDDLLAIHTNGFRGEALASIAAIAKVDLKTARSGDAMGTQIKIDAGKLIVQEPCSAKQGATFSVQSLFYNVPARRKFLKSDAAESRHIIEAFEKVALSHPEVAMELYNNKSIVYKLEAGKLRKRIVQLFGNNFDEKLLPLSENTNIVNLSGFLIKPEYSKKTRGEQFFFANNRFIKSPYLHHAIVNAFEGMISKENIPGYFLKLEIAPSKIDINIHPTKTEIKFEDERMIYAIIKSVVKQSLGQHSSVPGFNFDSETAFESSGVKNIDDVPTPGISVNPKYNPFQEKEEKVHRKSYVNPEKPKYNLKQWQSYFEDEDTHSSNADTQQDAFGAQYSVQNTNIFQLDNTYIVAKWQNQLLLVNQHLAHWKLLAEQLHNNSRDKKTGAQMNLFPETLDFAPKDFALLQDALPDLNQLGFNVEVFGSNTLLVRGMPAIANSNAPDEVFDQLLDQLKEVGNLSKNSLSETLISTLSKQFSIKNGQQLNAEEMLSIIEPLMQSKNPKYAPNGQSTYILILASDIEKMLKQKPI